MSKPLFVLTKYIDPVEGRGARILALSSDGNSRLYVAYDHALSEYENHENAAVEIVNRAG